MRRKESGLPTTTHGSVAVFLCLILILVFTGYQWNNFEKEHIVVSARAEGMPQNNISSKAQALTPTLIPVKVGVKESSREEKLQQYLESKKSPLANYSKLIVKLADEYDISWTLATAISGKESSFGIDIKPNSYNAWGIMAWDKDGNRHIRIFNSWEESIRFETALLSEYYRTNMNSAIQEKYCPSFECSDTWTNDVTSFQEAINE
jgi:hypothetical protein